MDLRHTFEPMTHDEPDAAVWFKGKSYNEETQRKALAGVEKWLKQAYGEKVALKRTPAGTGMGLLERSLPLASNGTTPIAFPALPEGIQRLIHATSFPHRWENFDRKAQGIEYDARSAFVGCCRWVPMGEVIHDDTRAYVPFAPGRYLVDVTVPRTWDHIGLVPVEHVPGEKYRRYPSTPGESWQVWLDGQEVDLLVRHQWPYQIHKRIVFPQSQKAPGHDPLRKWIEPIVSLLEQIERHPRYAEPDIKAIRHCIRVIALQTIGRFHATGGGEVMDIDPDTGEISVTEVPRLNAYTEKFHHPEWSAFIWAKNRCHVTRQALLVPKDDILCIHGDSLVLRNDPEWQDDGKVRSYRKKVA